MEKIYVIAAATALITSLSFGQQLRWDDIGGGLGYVSVSSNSTDQTLGGFVIAIHANLGGLAKDLTLAPDIEYFGTSKDVGGETITVSDFAINANVHYNIEMEGTVKPYLGAGLGFNALSTKTSAPIDTTTPAIILYGVPGHTCTGRRRIGYQISFSTRYQSSCRCEL